MESVKSTWYFCLLSVEMGDRNNRFFNLRSFCYFDSNLLKQKWNLVNCIGLSNVLYWLDFSFYPVVVSSLYHSNSCDRKNTIFTWTYLWGKRYQISIEIFFQSALRVKMFFLFICIKDHHCFKGSWLFNSSIRFYNLHFVLCTAALRDLQGNYLLNGNWRIDIPLPKEIAGTVFRYTRGKQASDEAETLTADGPTNQPLFLVVNCSLVRGNNVWQPATLLAPLIL